MTAQRETPFLVRALPKRRLRQVAEDWDLLNHFFGERDHYCEWMQFSEHAYRILLGYQPSPGQLQEVATVSLLQDNAGFLGYLLARGLTDFNKSKKTVDDCAAAGGAIAVMMWLDHRDGIGHGS
jgi:hypothetical protein